MSDPFKSKHVLRPGARYLAFIERELDKHSKAVIANVPNYTPEKKLRLSFLKPTSKFVRQFREELGILASDASWDGIIPFALLKGEEGGTFFAAKVEEPDCPILWCEEGSLEPFSDSLDAFLSKLN